MYLQHLEDRGQRRKHTERERAQFCRIQVEETIRHPSKDDKLSVGCLSSPLKNEIHALNEPGNFDGVDKRPVVPPYGSPTRKQLSRLSEDSSCYSQFL